MKNERDLLSAARNSDKVRDQMSRANNTDELIKAARGAGFDVDNRRLSSHMRDVASNALREHGLPDWAINSVLLGEAVCW